MKQLQTLVFKVPSMCLVQTMTIFICLISIGVNGQKNEKTFKEAFDVIDGAVLEVNTSYADITFETWNKNVVQIEATIELEGASDKEAQEYFENSGFDIMGNSQKVYVSTGDNDSWAFDTTVNMEDLHIEIPVIPEMESFDFEIDLSDIDDLPVMPPVPSPNFDYKAFKKDGEKYMKEWQKNFQKDFGEEYQKRMEEWQEKMEIKRNEMRLGQEQAHERRKEAHVARVEELAKKKVESAQKRVEALQMRMQDHQARVAQRVAARSAVAHRPNVFYMNTKGEHKNYKVKKTIKVKMPKSTKIIMNIRHGEVKLAQNTANIDATLTYASLLAATIDGDETVVTASYSPISVEKWNYGQLQTDYSEDVNLKEVMNLRLNATSSEVTIENLTNTAFIKNSFGPVHINKISNDFETLDASVQNGELFFKIPESAFKIYVTETESHFIVPPNLIMHKTNNHGSVVHKGFNRNEDSNKSMVINAQYSDVVLE